MDDQGTKNVLDSTGEGLKDSTFNRPIPKTARRKGIRRANERIAVLLKVRKKGIPKI